MMRNRSLRQSSASPAVDSGNRKQQGDDDGFQGVRRHSVADSDGRDQRRQQNAGKQFLATRLRGSVAGLDNLTAVQEVHRFLFAS